MPRIIKVFPDPEALAAAAAGAFADAAGASTGAFRVALSGGSTPRALYARLAQEPFRSVVPWSRVEIFFGDERCVPADHSDSNFRMADEALLRHVPLEPSRIHRVRTEFPPEEAARRYADEIRGPHFDWIFLGLGLDGHTASLFPGSPAIGEKTKLVTSAETPETKLPRVTVTVPVINAAAKILFVVAGAEKSEILRRVLEEPATRELPASLIASQEGEILWLLDAAAASALSPR